MIYVAELVDDGVTRRRTVDFENSAGQDQARARVRLLYSWRTQSLLTSLVLLSSSLEVINVTICDLHITLRHVNSREGPPSPLKATAARSRAQPMSHHLHLLRTTISGPDALDSR